MIVKLDDDIMTHLGRFHLAWEKVTKNMLISDSFIVGKRKTCFRAKIIYSKSRAWQLVVLTVRTAQPVEYLSFLLRKT